MAKFSERLGTATVEVRANTDKLRRDLGTARTMTQKTAARMAAAWKASIVPLSIAIGAITAGVVTLAHKFDNLAKAARRTGFEFETFQRLAVVAQIAGSDVGALEKTLSRFTKRLFDVELGLKEASDGFNLLQEAAGGAEINTKDANEAFIQTIEKLRSIEDVTIRNKAAFAIFGARQAAVALNFANMPLEEFNERMGQVKVITEDNAIVMERFNDNVKYLNKTNI